MSTQTTPKNLYLFARELHCKVKGTSRITEQLFELTKPFEFAWDSRTITPFPYLAVWQFPHYYAVEGQPATQLVGYVHDPRDTSVEHTAFILETWTGEGTIAPDALLNAEVFGDEGSGYKIW